MSVSLETLALAKKFAKNYADGLIGSQGIFMFENRASFPETGEDKKLYIANDTGKMYRWDAETAEYSEVGGAGKETEVEATLGASWNGSGPYTQPVTAQGYTVTENTRADIITIPSLVSQMVNDGVDLVYIENNDGVLTAYAFGNKPSAAMNIHMIFTEVN